MLEELGIEEKDTLLVLNKVDAAGQPHQIDQPAGSLSQRRADQRTHRAGTRRSWPLR